MKHFNTLSTFFDYSPNEDLSNLYIIGVQHLLETTGSLIEQIIEIGVPAKNIFLLGKLYSTNSDVKRKLKIIGVNILDSNTYQKPGYFKEILTVDVQLLWNKLWQNISKDGRIIILDDGGYVLKSIPQDLLKNNYHIVGIEQTTSGIWQLDSLDFPVINVAQSAVKKLIEPYLISKALHTKIKHILNQVKPKAIGVVGCGNIGKSIIEEFSLDYQIHIYDIEKARASVNKEYIIHNSINELFIACDVIIGSTGKDISSLSWLSIANENKLLISVSSTDIEFNTLLKEFSKRNECHYPLDNTILTTDKGFYLNLFRGGTVANFDGSPHSVPSDEIQLTRGLLYGAFIQALKFKYQSNIEIQKLSAQFQEKVLQLWFNTHPEYRVYYDVDLIEKFDSIEWIEKSS